MLKKPDIVRPKKLGFDDIFSGKNVDKPANLLVVTRVHMKEASKMPDPQNIVEFVKNSQLYATKILVCVGAADSRNIETYVNDAINLLTTQNLNEKVTFLPVHPWGYFVSSLNVAIRYAQDNDCSRIAFQSVEFKISDEAVRTLLRISTSMETVLVVGPEMNGHIFSEGFNAVTGRSIPWNTFAIWNVAHLSVTGFPMIGDGTASDRKIGGVEEVSTINLLQMVDPLLQAVLVRSSHSGFEWSTHFDDPERRSWHENKMNSKNDRPAKQMKIANIKDGTVQHLTLPTLETT